jgi:hypothetical protein
MEWAVRGIVQNVDSTILKNRAYKYIGKQLFFDFNNLYFWQRNN